MKQDWEIKKLGDVCETGAGGTPLKAHKDYYEGGTIPWLMSGEVSQGEILEAKNFITEKGLRNSSAKLFPPNTVLVAMYGATAGQVGILRFEASTNQAVCGVLPNNRTIPEYLFYCFLSKKEELISQAVGGAQPNISQIKIKNTKIPLPPLPEQQRIVAILDEAFAAIAKAKANAEQNLKNAKELFESLLIKIFIDGINVKKWNLEKLEKYNKVVVGYVGPISREYTNDENGVLLLSTKNISDNGVSLEKLTRINQQFHFKNKKSQLLPGDILVARHGNSGQAAVIKENIKEAHALNVIIIKKSAILSSEYICFLLNSGVLDKITYSKAGSVQEIINTSIIKDLIIPVPSVADQQTIVQKLHTLSAETRKLECIYQQKINDLEELKKSILQKAFSGELKTSKEEAA